MRLRGHVLDAIAGAEPTAVHAMQLAEPTVSRKASVRPPDVHGYDDHDQRSPSQDAEEAN